MDGKMELITATTDGESEFLFYICSSDMKDDDLVNNNNISFYQPQQSL